jgi:tellurite resistance protein
MDQSQTIKNLIKYLSLEKKQAIVTCLALVAAADNDISDKENAEAIAQARAILDLSPDEFNKSKMRPQELRRILDDMSGEELVILGLLMGRVAESDGKIDNRELDLIRTILKAAKLNPNLIENIISKIK